MPVWERDTFQTAARRGGARGWIPAWPLRSLGNHEDDAARGRTHVVKFTVKSGGRGRVIDAGCGSGILALSAVKLGYGDVVAFDNDLEAVRVSEENAALNEFWRGG